MSVDLVTGGAGFIGSHVARRLVADGRSVRVVDDLSTGNLDRIADLRTSIDFVHGDLATADLAPVVSGVDRIFHLAAVPSVPRSVRDPVTTHSSVATATLRLLVAAKEAGIRRFVLSSSSSVYGETIVSPKHESLEARPMSPYATAKLAAELYTRQFAALYGMSTVSLRYFNVFGPWQDPASAYAAVIPRFITQAMRGDALTVHGDGSQTRDFTYVADVVEANLRAAQADDVSGRVYNIAAGAPHSLRDLIKHLEDLLEHPLEVGYGPARAGDIRHSHADISAAGKDLGWRPQMGFREGLERTTAWLRTR